MSGNVGYLRRRLFGRGYWSRSLLALFMFASLVQYLDTREVTWVTQSFKTIEDASLGLWNEGEWRSSISIPEVSLPELPELPALNSTASSSVRYDLTGTVTKVKDGDTFVLRDATGKSHTIRLQGVDTPETNQPQGRAASKFLSRRLKDELIELETHGKGYYGRTIGTVYIDGANVNAELVCAGHGWWYQRYAPNDQMLATCEQSARTEQLGLWGAENPVPPWEWRRK